MSAAELRALLQWCGVPVNILDVIFGYWDDVRLSLHVGGVVDAEKLETFAGVLQGDPLSPYLFNICVDYILRQVRKEIGVDVSSFSRFANKNKADIHRVR